MSQSSSHDTPVTYDAFISYRHLPLDEAVAGRLQELLERYRPPKGIGEKNTRIERIFLDKTELPTSGDLGNSLQEALLNSHYLIVVLSEETKNSKWCMEEIRQFKEAHNERINFILPILVSGDPSDAIPDLLRFEKCTDVNGNRFSVEVEPLCCDVRAESIEASLKKLKTEFLRIAAPLLACSFDDLYQRHKRRMRQQQLIGGISGVVLALTLGIFGFQSYYSKRQYEENLLNTYLTRGSEMMNSEEMQALSAYENALELNPSSQAAKTGTLMLLQQNIWLEHTDTIPAKQQDISETPDYKEILQKFDLSKVFPQKESEQDSNEWYDFWMDENHKLAILYNGFSAAAFYVEDEHTPYLSAIHTVYGYGLNMTAFSKDSSYYALVYGNDYGIDLYNPGGYVEVYDAAGNLCMATPVNKNFAAKGAAFEPGGSRLLVWDNSTLQIWDIDTGELATAPLHMDNIDSVFWTDDGCIGINTGDNAQIYTPTQYLPTASAPQNIIPADSIDVSQTSIQLINGYWLKHDYSNIWLEDENGTIIGTPAKHQINKMYALTDSNTAYFWYDNSDNLVRVSISPKGISTKTLDTVGFHINDVRMTPSGLVAFTGNNNMLYYPENEQLPVYTMAFASSGIMHEAASLKNGLFAVLLRTTEYESADSYEFDSLYSLELWDLHTGLCVARPETECSLKLEHLTLTDDGWLLYEKNGTLVSYLAESPQMIEKALYSKEYLPSAISSPAQETIQQMETILKEQGKEAWLSQYNEVWNKVRTDNWSLSEINILFRDYIWTGHSLGYTDNLSAGFLTYTDALIADKGQDWIASYSFSLLYMQYMLLTDAYDDIMINYWYSSAQLLEKNLDMAADDWLYDIMDIYSNRLYAILLLGYGEDSYYLAMDKSYWDDVPQLLIDSTLDRLYYLTLGNSQKAINLQEKQMKVYYDTYGNNPEEYAYELKNFIMFTMLDFYMFEQRGIISEDDLNTFVNGLSVDIGIQLTDVTPQNMDAGLCLGDIVFGVNGKPIYNQYHLTELMEKYPTAVLNVKRQNETFTTKPIDNWSLSGDFYIE